MCCAWNDCRKENSQQLEMWLQRRSNDAEKVRAMPTCGSMLNFRRLDVTVFCIRLLYEALLAAYRHRSLSSIRQQIWSAGPRESSSPELNPLFIFVSISTEITFSSTNKSLTSPRPIHAQFFTLFEFFSYFSIYFPEFSSIHNRTQSVWRLKCVHWLFFWWFLFSFVPKTIQNRMGSSDCEADALKFYVFLQANCNRDFDRDGCMLIVSMQAIILPNFEF